MGGRGLLGSKFGVWGLGERKRAGVGWEGRPKHQGPDPGKLGSPKP